jgi:hypothetical protein
MRYVSCDNGRRDRSVAGSRPLHNTREMGTNDDTPRGAVCVDAAFLLPVCKG